MILVLTINSKYDELYYEYYYILLLYDTVVIHEKKLTSRELMFFKLQRATTDSSKHESPQCKGDDPGLPWPYQATVVFSWWVVSCLRSGSNMYHHLRGTSYYLPAQLPSSYYCVL